MSLLSLLSGRTSALLGLTLLAACGGSGGGTTVVTVLSNATFAGDYFAVFKLGGHTTGPEGIGTTGILVADGAGAALHTQIVNDEGTVSGPETTDYTFAVAADGTLELLVGSNVFARGGVSADGECALLGTALPGSFPGVLVLARRQGPHERSSLSGAYHFVDLLFGALGGSSVAYTGTAVFDGTGGATLAVTVNGMGTIVSTSGSMTYDVIADGTSTLTLGTAVLEGGVFAGATAGVWAGSTTPGAPEICAVVRGATSANLATLQGAYWLVLLERDPGSDDFRSLHGTATSDGAGNLTLLASSNTEGVIAAEPPQATTYAVMPNGKLTVDAGGSVLVGGVSQDGRFAILGGGTAPGSNPTIAFLRRK